MNHAEITGIALALVAMVCFSLYMAPRKKSVVCERTYSVWMGLSILVSASVVGLITENIRPITPAQYLLIFGGGLVWSTGGFGYAMGVKLIGLFRSTPIKNTSAVLGALSGIFILQEFPLDDRFSLTLIILGSIAILAPAVMITRLHSTTEEQSQSTDFRCLLLGAFWSFWAAIAFTAYAIPMKIAYGQGITPIEFLFYMSQGLFVGLIILALISGSKSCANYATWRDRGWALLTGLTWTLGAVCSNYAVFLVGVAITWPLTRNPVLTVLFGALVFREVDINKHKNTLFWGMALSLLGIIFISVAAVSK